jgi:transposase
VLVIGRAEFPSELRYQEPGRLQASGGVAVSIAEQRMVTVLGEFGLTELVTSITGLSAVGAASILAETGDPARCTSGRALVKHAGLAPRQKSSGSYTGRSRMTGQGRPALRLAAWRTVWGALKSNPVYAARLAHLTGREHNKLSTGQAHAAIAAALLRHLHAVITTGQRWDPAIATGGRPSQTLTAA